MALTVVTVTVSSGTYTIPTGKIAKVILNKVDNASGGGSLVIGEYSAAVEANDDSTVAATTGSISSAYIVVGARGILREHYLIAGQIISTSVSTLVASFTVFLEDA
jgi:hypothetical protein